MSDEPEDLVLQILRDMRADMTGMRAEMASDLIEVCREIAGVRKELGERIVGLRRAMIEHHTSLVGHGVLISEREARLRRVDQHLELPPLDAH